MRVRASTDVPATKLDGGSDARDMVTTWKHLRGGFRRRAGVRCFRGVGQAAQLPLERASDRNSKANCTPSFTLVATVVH